jgi:hypothetical protein
MSKNLIKKYMFVGVIIMVADLFFIPTFSASISSNNLQNYTTKLSIKNTASIEAGKPDLIVNSMSFSPYGDSGKVRVAAATIKNIGDTKAIGTFYLKYTFTRTVFGIIAYIDTVPMTIYGGLESGATAYWPLIYEYRLPKFGFFEFKCTVNPGGTIEESNYDNNILAQNYFAFLGHWKQM